MRRLLILFTTLALTLAAPIAPVALAAPADGVQLTLSLANTAADYASARIWLDGSGKQHVRGLPVHDELVDATGATVGTMDRHVNFNVLPRGGTHAWCDLVMHLNDYGTFDGHCEGSLAGGSFIAHGGNGSTNSGTYSLVAGGIAGIGPYSIDMTIVTH